MIDPNTYTATDVVNIVIMANLGSIVTIAVIALVFFRVDGTIEAPQKKTGEEENSIAKEKPPIDAAATGEADSPRPGAPYNMR